MIGTGGDRYDVEKLSLLADFRDRLQLERNLPENRVHGRNRRGVVLVKRDGSVGTGSYTMDYRQTLLDRLTLIEEQFGEPLITEAERRMIRQIWVEEEADLAIALQKKLEGEA
jgi:hypothetical protein